MLGKRRPAGDLRRMIRGFLGSFAGSYLPRHLPRHLPGHLTAASGASSGRGDREGGRGLGGLGPEKPHVAEARPPGDVTGRKPAEDAPKEGGERFRALVQNSLDVITLLEVDGTILYASPSVERVLGYRPEELIGKNAFDYVHPGHLERVLGAFAEFLSDPDLRPFLEYRFRHKDGTWRWLESVGANLIEDPNVGELVVNSRDVTGRKLAEKRYRHLVENVPVVIYEQWPVEG
jgi:PAS domain S-box-containing protein